MFETCQALSLPQGIDTQNRALVKHISEQTNSVYSWRRGQTMGGEGRWVGSPPHARPRLARSTTRADRRAHAHELRRGQAHANSLFSLRELSTLPFAVWAILCPTAPLANSTPQPLCYLPSPSAIPLRPPSTPPLGLSPCQLPAAVLHATYEVLRGSLQRAEEQRHSSQNR